MPDDKHPGYWVTPVTPNFQWTGDDCLACPRTGLVRVDARFLEHMEALQELRSWYRGVLKVVQGYAWSPAIESPAHAAQAHLLGTNPDENPSGFATDVEPSPMAAVVPLRAPMQKIVEAVARKAEGFGFTGIGLYNTYVHLDRRPGSLVVWDERVSTAGA